MYQNKTKQNASIMIIDGQVLSKMWHFYLDEGTELFSHDTPSFYVSFVIIPKNMSNNKSVRGIVVPICTEKEAGTLRVVHDA